MAEEPSKPNMDVTTLLRDYSGWVDTGDIQFLEKEAPRSEVKECVDALWCIMDKLREKDELREKQEGKWSAPQKVVHYC